MRANKGSMRSGNASGHGRLPWPSPLAKKAWKLSDFFVFLRRPWTLHCPTILTSHRLSSILSFGEVTQETFGSRRANLGEGYQLKMDWDVQLKKVLLLMEEIRLTS